MKLLQRIGVGLAGIVIVATVLALAAPKVVHAMVAALVRDVDNPGRATRVTASCLASSNVGGTGVLDCNTGYVVPAGERLVIEQVEAQCFTPRDSIMQGGTLNVFSGYVSNQHPLLLGFQSLTPSGNQADYRLNQLVRYYADPGSGLTFDDETSDSSGQTSCIWSASGYLISYP